MKRILIGTPIGKSDGWREYTLTLIGVLGMKMPGVVFDWATVGGTGVNFARNELAMICVSRGFDELIFWDLDLKAEPGMFVRMVEHDADIVCTMYSKKTVATQWHLQGIEGAEPDAKTGLLKVANSAIGFSKIRRNVFETMAKKFPERWHKHMETGEPEKHKYEFFPMEIVGKNTADAKLEHIRYNLNAWNGVSHLEKADLFKRFTEILDASDYSDNVMLGEDFGFCRLARLAGFDIHLDTAFIVPHEGPANYPLPSEEMEAALKEPWRKDAEQK